MNPVARWENATLEVLVLVLCLSGSGNAQQAQVTALPSETSAGEPPLTAREKELLDRIDKLEHRLALLETRGDPASIVSPLPATHRPAVLADAPQPQAVAATVPPAQTAAPASTGAGPTLPAFLSGTTFNLNLDTYYGYNFNRPIGRINLLRAYDVSSNSFSLNQAGVVIERLPDPKAGRPFGVRLDLQYGQATEAAQGSPANELRPQVYRPVWQAYGTYVAPLGHGLTVDFGKFASSLGFETNYTKDDLNYSRSYYFSFLPFYHFGLRAKYPLNDHVTVMYHLMNGVQQSEDFNEFKSQHFAVILTPTKTVTWQINYYFGREQRDVVPELNLTFPTLPTQPGLSTNVIRPAPRGRLHILDTYATWTATRKVTLGAEVDDVINRIQEYSAPAHVNGGAGYARYQFTPEFGLAARAEYLSDRGGLFSGQTQALKETTLTSDYKVAEGLLVRAEWRRDFSNQAFFLTSTSGILKREQNTATMGIIWWFGGKEGAW
jgi:hypothetical protein